MRRSTLVASMVASIFLVSLQAISQTVGLRSPFISGNIGVFITAVDSFDKVYDSHAGFAFGGGVGLPISTRTYLYGKMTRFTKSGVPVIYTYHFQGGALIDVTESREGVATFKQWIFNLGLQYNLFLSEEFTLGIIGGGTYGRVSEEQRRANGSIVFGIEGATLFGFFGGIAMERNFRQSPVSVFLESQYNYSRRDLVNFLGNYGGTNLTLGIRYYFSERRTQ
jgi:hypothetical protein